MVSEQGREAGHDFEIAAGVAEAGQLGIDGKGGRRGEEG
jgi:hypothetical protein